MFQVHCSNKWRFPLKISLVNVSISRNLRICSQLLKKSLTEKFFWVVVSCRLCLHFNTLLNKVTHFRSSRPEVFLGKGVLKICSKVTGEHLCRSVILIKLLWNFIEITLRHWCSPVNLLHIFRNPFPKNTSGWLLLTFENYPELRSSFKI